jgi:hypothetical protein
VRWRRRRRGEKSEIRSLVERLKALEHTDLPSPAAAAGPAVPTSIAAGRSRSLIRWFSIGFACACIAGGIALLAAVTDSRATEAEPPVAPALGLLQQPGGHCSSEG